MRIIALLASLLVPAFAQTISGDKIPDNVALRIVLSNHPTCKEVGLLGYTNAKVDCMVYRDTLCHFHYFLEDSPQPPGPMDYRYARENAEHFMEAAMTPEGREKLKAYVQSQKRTMAAPEGTKE